MGLVTEHGGLYSRAGVSPRGCWYYLRYFFLFVSLIQLLIILGLVLFMVYGNVHVGTESNLQATERRADGLYGQVMGLLASQANLSKELNITARTKESLMQMLLNTRREQDRINASFRQCQADLVVYMNNQRYMAAIILSEKQCQEQLKETNKSCNALLLMLNQKVKALEADLTKEKELCSKDKDGLVLSRRVVEEQLAECGKAREQQRQERQLAENRLLKVQTLCLPLDKDKFEMELRNIWRDSIIPRTLDSLGYNLYHPLSSDLASIRRTCDHMPTLMTTKVEELAHSLRAGIERVARENSDLQRQKLEAEQGLRTLQEAKEKVEKEVQAREAKLQTECARQTQLALEEKAAIRKERDSLSKELEETKRQVEQLKMQLAVSNTALDTCIRAKSQPIPMPRPVGPAPKPQPIDPASLEEFKRRILESQRLTAGNIPPPSSG
ncbi:plasmalemma vesicle-associated protein [Manis pentadactyla]|uniref:plasmalemma vesicle-associated protein n=1 Tax=Manis pentadactyla TaxID=143292 RepID=UPI00255C4D66|nr:plasmalemma vesicle-associated protein [Manis pentadactyla]